MQVETASGAGFSHAKLAGVIAGSCAAAILALGKDALTVRTVTAAVLTASHCSST